ncbi:hypothetical protein ACIA8O_04490 [Kitasatospora sp. NPDC051853]|uniref:LppU/SCO3897 family protein n=1 Tax=Kitasatospora sp. NPDC051853 TaxID=3364058 RepID=UPI0037A16DF6
MSTPPTADQYADERPRGSWDPAAPPSTGPVPPVPPPLLPKRRARRLLRASLTSLALVVAIGAALFAADRYYRDAPMTANAGDCVHNSGTDADPEVSVVDCTAPEAELKVIKMIHLADQNVCDDVPGTVATYREERTRASFSLCLGPNDRS